jgi:hypothetical protein
LVSVACLPSDVLMVSCLSYFRIAERPRQIEALVGTGIVSDSPTYRELTDLGR